MGFSEAIRHCLASYATFQGRARRSEYWYFALFGVLVSVATGLLDLILFPGFESSVISLIASLALLLPTLAVSVRRLHDTGRSGWWLLVGLVPLVGALVLLIWACQRSDAENRFGPPPAGTAPG
jgi:uncharacterized membrane protein YhaH (DUF805 family)